jgi:hypothetical protein
LSLVQNQPPAIRPVFTPEAAGALPAENIEAAQTTANSLLFMNRIMSF